MIFHIQCNLSTWFRILSDFETVKMTNTNHIIVLSKCRQILEFSNLYENCNWTKDSRNTPKYCLMHVLWAIYSSFVALEIWNIYQHSYSPLLISQALNAIQVHLIYFSLLSRKEIINDSIRRLQELIDQRTLEFSNFETHFSFMFYSFPYSPQCEREMYLKIQIKRKSRSFQSKCYEFQDAKSHQFHMGFTRHPKLNAHRFR